MLMLVMSNNFPAAVLRLEAVGLVSYLLIGFLVHQKPTAIFANMKAFLVNRVGDFGFIPRHRPDRRLCRHAELHRSLRQGGELAAAVPGNDWMLITVICICLFIGAMGKSAQFRCTCGCPIRWKARRRFRR